MEILVTMPVTEMQKKQFMQIAPEAAFRFLPAKTLTATDIATAEVIIGNVPPALLPAAKQLRWLQLNSAGADAYCHEGVLSPSVQLTNATGAYGLALSEHMLALLLAMMKKLYLYHDHQKQQVWQDEGEVTSIAGAKALIVGFGDIGSAFARRLHALGATVFAIRRRVGEVPPYVQSLHTLADLDILLPQADIVASVLPNSAATQGLFTKARFLHMKKTAYFLNVGRGSAVDSLALAEVLQQGHLAGAAMDVTDPEPLPPGHPLWNAPRAHITPHIAGDFHLRATQEAIVKIASENLQHFLRGESLQNRVDRKTGYKA